MTNFKNIICEINKKESGKRLDQALTNLISNFSRSQIKLLLVNGNIRKSNIEFRNASYKVKEGEKFEIYLPVSKKSSRFHAQDIPINIIHEDEHIIVLDKQSGMVTHPAPGNEENTLPTCRLQSSKIVWS